MRRKLIIVAACSLVAGLAAAPGAEAGHRDWSFGAGFHVGGVHFRIGLHHPATRHYGFHPGPYFYTSHRLSYSGYRCHGACFRRGAEIYHHYGCPLVGHHFGRAGYSPGYYLGLFAPPAYRSHYGGHYRDRYRGHYGRSPSRSHGYYLYLDGYAGRYRDRGRHGHRGYRSVPPGRRHHLHRDFDRGRGWRHFDRGRRGRDFDRHRRFRDDRHDADRGRRGRRRGHD